MNSGMDVPNATTVRPIIRSDTPNRFARSEAPSTSQSAPLTKIASPPKKQITKNHIVDNKCVNIIKLY